MSLDLQKLENVVHKQDGRIIARCPACAAEGGDKKGEHLIVRPDGKFGCVVRLKDKHHNKQIMALAGVSGGKRNVAKIPIVPLKIPESKIELVVGRLGRGFSNSAEGESSSQD